MLGVVTDVQNNFGKALDLKSLPQQPDVDYSSKATMSQNATIPASSTTFDPVILSHNLSKWVGLLFNILELVLILLAFGIIIFALVKLIKKFFKKDPLISQ